MAFWGVEVKPGKPVKHFPYGIKGRLHVSQATLGICPSGRKEKSRVECKIGKKGSPVILCCLWPDKCESSQLNLEFDESREVVFSVIGPTSVHITGFFVKGRTEFLLQSPPETSDEEPFGEDIGDSSSEYNRSQDDDDEFEDDSFIVPDSPCYSNDHKAGKEEEGKAGDVIRKRKRVLYQGVVSDEEGGEIIGVVSDNNIAKKVVVSDTDTSDVDNKAVNTFFNLLGGNNYKKLQQPSSSSSFSPIINNDLSSKELAGVDVPSSNTTEKHIILKPKDENVVFSNNKIITDSIATAVEEECKKKKESKVMSSDDEKKDHRINNTPTDYNEVHGEDEAEAKAAPPWSTTLPNGLLIEDIKVGYRDGKIALPGKEVTIHFTGKIKENEEVIDSSVGGEPLKFYLGSGQVMSGWDDGINGMRVGGKRRLTIPPSLWKKSERHPGKQIRSKASLVYKIQLLGVS